MGPTSKNKQSSTTESEKPLAAAAASPRKKEGKRPTLKDMKGSFLKIGSKLPSLLVYGFGDEFSVEAYMFVKDEYNDSFLNGFRRFVSKDITVNELAEAGFLALADRRVPHCKQDASAPASSILKNTVGTFSRKIMVRFVPQAISTPESRAEGLRILKAFLMSKQNSDYPPNDILTFDCTNESSPDSLDTFFLDQEIITIIKTDIVEENWKELYSKFTLFIPRLWSGNNYPKQATEEFGFPPL
jgi:hypothetical protein